MLSAYGVTHKGRVRATNEDYFAVQEDLGLCVIADGMGGHNAGEVAARLVVDSVVETCTVALKAQGGGPDRARDEHHPFGVDVSLSADGNLLRTAIQTANIHVLETAATAHHFAGMGTTVVAARAAHGHLAIGHVGDSRLYLLAGGRLRQLTHDDSWVAGILEDDPDTNPAVLRSHPMRHVLTNVVGAGSPTTVHIIEAALDGGELLLLTTDGVHGVLTDTWLERALQANEEPPQLAHSIVDGALRRGSRDNCTAIVARYTAR